MKNLFIALAVGLFAIATSVSVANETAAKPHSVKVAKKSAKKKDHKKEEKAPEAQPADANAQPQQQPVEGEKK